ncbi:7045_t:CDS:1 [Ambispora leptoticha]|uniref:7045_t:CDS:1 n=1 Tax=Ambispora leptoticha TaxID=144679 RepID=A0A9N9A508_9GLOM|nr:7045_t:CDS:1 [Ambispora leptoticha]
MASTVTITKIDSRTNCHHLSHYYPTSTTTIPTKTKIRNLTSNTAAGSWNDIPVDLDDPGSYSYHPTAAMVQAAKIDYANRMFEYTLEKLYRAEIAMNNKETIKKCSKTKKTTTAANGTTKRNVEHESTPIDAVSSRSATETSNFSATSKKKDDEN